MYIFSSICQNHTDKLEEITMENTEFTTQLVTNNQTNNTIMGNGDQDVDTLIMFKYQLYIYFVIIPIGIV